MGIGTLAIKRDFSSGLPRLRVQGIPLSESEMKAVEDEAVRMYAELIQKNNKVITLHASVEQFPTPAQFRVRVRPGASERCPDIFLEPLFELPRDDGNTFADAQSNPRWFGGFFSELDELFAPHVLADVGEPDRVALDFVLDELRRLAATRPRALSPLLVCGYVALGERMCAQHDRERLGMYVLAGRGLDDLFNSLLPDLPARAHDEPRPFTVKLRAVGRFLARLLHIKQPDELDAPFGLQDILRKPQS